MQLRMPLVCVTLNRGLQICFLHNNLEHRCTAVTRSWPLPMLSRYMQEAACRRQLYVHCCPALNDLVTAPDAEPPLYLETPPFQRET